MRKFDFDAIIVGAGHAGVEAALALARTGARTLVLTLNLDSVAFLACNPSIGGTAKGHLVREIDALGGEMAIAADNTTLQLKLLNESKGAAVQSLRAQVDKHKYHFYMKQKLENQPNLTIKQCEVLEVLVDNAPSQVCIDNGAAAVGSDPSTHPTSIVVGVRTTIGDFFAGRVIVASGVYLKSQIITGEHVRDCGPNGFERATALSASLQALGLRLRRFKTGTPARIDSRTVDFSVLEEQRGNKAAPPFSHMTKRGEVDADKIPCFLGYTTAETKRVITDNIHRAPMFSGLISGTGARYCPSIEDKVVRFADKERHQFFLEPEGEATNEMYLQGISTSLPYDVQVALVRSLDGMRAADIMRSAYAIEYDCIDPQQLDTTLEFKGCAGLYFAGQINGTSGYEEAAAQGLVAGLNASLALRGLPALRLNRHQAYIGVLIDDLVTKGTNEPYRMMTSRAEYRLQLRQDNADTRLTEIGKQAGTVGAERWAVFQQKHAEKARVCALLGVRVASEVLQNVFAELGEKAPTTPLTMGELFKRTQISAEHLARLVPQLQGFGLDALSEVVVEQRYEGYLVRQNAAIKTAKKLEQKMIDKNINYAEIKGLRLEAVQKLTQLKPTTIGQASRISGVSPADITVLIIYLSKMGF